MRATAEGNPGYAGVGAPAGVGQAGVGAPAGEMPRSPMTITPKMPGGEMTMKGEEMAMKTDAEMGVPAGVPTKMAPPGHPSHGVIMPREAMSTQGPPMDITPLVTALTTINNTLIGSLASIESRAKNNDINSELIHMNDLLSEISSGLPAPSYGGGKVVRGKSKSKKKGRTTARTAEKAAVATKVLNTTVPATLGGVISVLSQINTTLQTSLAAIENRLKMNDVNPELQTMNDYLSQINANMPIPAEGGGTRRSRMKKRKQTLRHRRT